MTIPRQWAGGVSSMTVDPVSGLPKLLYTDAAALDTNMQRALDKSASGGTLAGAITVATGSTLSFDSFVAGLVISGASSSLRTPAAGGGRIKAFSGTVPLFSAFRSFTRVLDILEYANFSSTSVSPTTNRWNVDNATVTLTPNLAATTLWCPITRAWDGATLASVSVSFIVDGTRSGLPSVYPSIQVFRFDPFRTNVLANGSNITADMALRASLAPQSFAAPANITAYINGGTPNVLTFTCSANNVIDVSNYCYFVTVVDENYSGAGGFVPNKYVGMTATYSVVNDTRFQ